MSWFHNLSTLAKLLGTFAILCVILVGVGYLGLSAAGGIKTNLDTSNTNLLPSAIAVGNMSEAVERAQVNVRNASMTSDATETAQFIKAVGDQFAEAEKEEAVFRALPMDPLDARILVDYDQAYNTWKGFVNDAMKSAALNTDAGNAAAMDILLHKAAPAATQIDKDLNDLVGSQVRQGNALTTMSNGAYDSASRLLIGTIIGAVIAAMALGFYVARSLANPLGTMVAAANGIAEGDLDQEITLDRKDEVGQAAAALRRAIAYLRGIAEVADAMAEGDLTRSVEPKSPRDGLGVAFKGMISNLRELVGQVQSSAISLAETSAQLGSAAAQAGSAVQQVTMAVQNVASGAQETSRSAQETTSAVGQLSQVIDGIARGATDQARQVQTTSATATEMAAGVEEVATNATHMATAGQQTRVVAERGGQAVRETTAAMAEIQSVVGQAAGKVRELGVLGQKIGAVVETIDDIAEQTNLLALNAAIEAARAGEHGKGFAVVADEVRKLAERSGRETKQIAELIAQVQTGTKEAVGAMDNGAAKVELGTEKAAQAGEALEEILAAVQDTVRQVGEIASSSRQMAGGARSVTDAMHSISAVVEESSAATEEMAAQASAVSGSIQSIASVSEQQSAATEQVSASTEEMSAQVEEMAAQAQELANTADNLKQLVARFTLDNASNVVVSARRSTAKTATPLRRAA
jgi:methyl-accepting chemotaxis protein